MPSTSQQLPKARNVHQPPGATTHSLLPRRLARAALALLLPSSSHSEDVDLTTS